MLRNIFDAFGQSGTYAVGLLLIGLVLTLQRYTKKRREYEAETLLGEQHDCKPIKARYPCKWPLGLDVLYAQYKANADKRLLAFQQPFLDRLGPNLAVDVLGTVGYTTFDPKNIEAILSSRFEDYHLGTRRGALFPFIGEGIFTQDGGSWKHSRELLRRPFLKTHYQDLRGFTKPLDDLVTAISSSCTVVDLQPLFFRFTLATTTALIFGVPIKFEDDVKNDFARSFDYASKISALRMRLVDFYWAYRPSGYTVACINVKEYADGFVKQALGESIIDTGEATQGRYAFVEDLYHELKDPALVRDQLVNVLLAGRDTTACLLSWTL